MTFIDVFLPISSVLAAWSILGALAVYIEYRTYRRAVEDIEQ